MDASLTASDLDFFALRLGLGELDPCEPHDGEPLAGVCLMVLVLLPLVPVSEASGVGGDPNWYGLVVYCVEWTSAWSVNDRRRQITYVGVSRHQPLMAVRWIRIHQIFTAGLRPSSAKRPCATVCITYRWCPIRQTSSMIAWNAGLVVTLVVLVKHHVARFWAIVRSSRRRLQVRTALCLIRHWLILRCSIVLYEFEKSVFKALGRRRTRRRGGRFDLGHPESIADASRSEYFGSNSEVFAQGR